MLIDFHTHVFPDKIANAALRSLSARSGEHPNTDGTANGLICSMKESGVDISVILPVVTNADQFKSINLFASELNCKREIVSFGGIHPDCEGLTEKLDYIKSLGLLG